MRLVSLVSLLFLARLLAPADFGLVALAVVVTSTASLFSTAGMGAAFIASRADPRVSSFHAGAINAVLGLLLFLALIALASPLAVLLGDDSLVPVLLVMSPVLLLDTWAVIPEARLMREVRFGRRAIAHVTSSVAQAVVAVTCAAAGLGLWSLVAGLITASAVRLLLVVALAPRQPGARPRWDWTLARGLAAYGGTAMGTTLVRHTYSNADNVIVGRLFGASALGFYSQAFTLTNLPVQSISQVTNAVLMPVYARIRDDRERLAAAYGASFRLVAAVSLPSAFALLVLAPDAVLTVLGDQWGSSVVLLQALAGVAVFRPLSGTTSPLFLADERPGLNLRTAVFQAVVLVPGALLLAVWGAAGVGLAVSSAFALGFIFNLWQVRYRTDVPVRIWSLLRSILPAFLATGFMCGVAVGLKVWLGVVSGLESGSLLLLLLLIAASGGTYVGTLAVIDRPFLRELVRMLRRREPAAAVPLT